MTGQELSRVLSGSGLLGPVDPDVPSIVDLAGSLSRWLGGSPDGHIPSLSRQLEECRGIVFVIADGLGLEQLERSAPDGFLASHIGRELRSVYPSTTATALTSLASATWAGRHGVTGWWTHLPGLSRTMCALTFRERETGLSGRSLAVGMAEIVSGTSLYRTDRARVASFLPAYIRDSDFARWTRSHTPIHGYRTLGHALRRAGRAARNIDGRFLLSVYLPHVDSAIHKWGTSHAEIGAVIGELDRGMARLRRRLPGDVAVLLTADHGLIDLDRNLHSVIEDNDPLLETLYLPPTGEGTNPIFHVKPGAEQRFCERLTEIKAGKEFTIVPTDTLAQAGFFGPQGVDPALRSRFGTHVGIAPRPALLEYVPSGRRAGRDRGIHGGLRPGEMRVPLCLAVR